MDLMTTADAAKHLGVTPRRLYKLIDSHRISAYRYARVIRLDLPRSMGTTEASTDSATNLVTVNRGNPIPPQGASAIALDIDPFETR